MEQPLPGTVRVGKSRRVVRASVGRRPVVPSGLDAAAGSKRTMLADYLKMLAWWLGRPPTPAMPPRLEQALRGLLQGRSEKQIAADLGVSVHTVHEYVKELHRRLGVTSRGELIARFLPTSPGRAIVQTVPAVGRPVDPPVASPIASPTSAARTRR